MMTVLSCILIANFIYQENRSTEIVKEVFRIDSLANVSPHRLEVWDFQETCKILKSENGQIVYFSIHYKNESNKILTYYFAETDSLIAIKSEYDFLDEVCTGKLLHNESIYIFQETLIGTLQKLKYVEGGIYVDDPFCQIKIPKDEYKIFETSKTLLLEKRNK